MAQSYVTLLATAQQWVVRQGIGSSGRILIRLAGPPVRDLSWTGDGTTCLLCSPGPNSPPQMFWLALATQEVVAIESPASRIDAVALSTPVQRLAVLELPNGLEEPPRIWLQQDGHWQLVQSDVAPDISTRLAWLDDSRLVFESDERRLTVLDVESGSVETGPPACCMAVAQNQGVWYAVSDGRVVSLPVERPFAQPPEAPSWPGARDVSTLRVTMDGRVFTWRESRIGHRARGFVQERGRGKIRIPELESGEAAVLGPFDDRFGIDPAP